MTPEIANLSNAARQAIARRDWATVTACANGILQRSPNEAEGFFLLGMAEKAAERPRNAVEAFEKVLGIDPDRYDAAVELASQHSMARRNALVAELLERYAPALDNSPRYLDLAGTVYTQIGLPEKAWPLFVKANELQDNIPLFQANLAACAVFVGEIDVAKETYRKLLDRTPQHQRNHYELARLERATDRDHIDEMEAILAATDLPVERNVFLYFALGKEYEDLGEWDKSFDFYERGGDAVMRVADYAIETDVAIIDKVIDVCNADWLQSDAKPQGKTPIFVVGLPRTGTTLTERIIGSHSLVQSVGETEFAQMAIRRASGVQSPEKMTPEMLDAVRDLDISFFSSAYLDALSYRLKEQPYFIEKLPFNVLYLGFVAKAWPDAPMVLLRRNPMDSCFSMYKQVFTWAYKFSYSLENLGTYYIAYERLCRHWQEVLGDRLVVVDYETLVANQEQETRRLLDGLDLAFEEACLGFDKNAAPSATASSIQVREKVHTRSVGKWKRFEQHLAPLRRQLEQAGIDVE